VGSSPPTRQKMMQLAPGGALQRWISTSSCHS
jgi:hypothetical protein